MVTFLDDDFTPLKQVLACLPLRYLDSHRDVAGRRGDLLINSFDSSPQLGNICLMVHGLNKISPFFPFMLTDAFLDVFIQSWQFRRGTISFAEVVLSGHHVQYFCWYRFLVESVSSSRDVVRCCFEYNCTKDLLISLTVCWK